MVDMHSHFLFGIDDGAKSVQESLSLLTILRSQGVECVAATPHYNASKCEITHFLQKRAESLNTVLETASSNHVWIPKIVLGAEVSLTENLTDIDKISRLCYENTTYILIEMPYTPWQDWMFNMLFELSAVCGVSPIIAHIDKYITRKDSFFDIERLLEMNFPIQMNIFSYLDFARRRVLKKMIRKGQIQLIGSDCHNLDHRPPLFDRFCEKLPKNDRASFIAQADSLARMILSGEDIF